eukprot:CAMPEP_0197056682 /NCGR_PEP_ID=MMETSP1384-20130603/88735_1 /TAXON_ID=29189 /ORGANISM="Ammonia sp." /LENGTH=188 /DNA_ID=CAMNT_0042490781 /DNA_START=23 /DNA_END=589 /DNA_ORIENTATION=+
MAAAAKGKNPKYFLRDKKNEKVYLDITIDGDERGRIVITVFSGIVKKTAANFIAFCKGTTIDKKKHSYKGNKFHRSIVGFMIQGGDVVNGDGTGSLSIYGKTFKDENFKIAHAQYAVSMANSGKDTNGCQFFINFDANEHLDGKHCVFGFVEDKKSQKLIDEIEQESGSLDGAPGAEVKIAKCGVVKK